MPDWNPNSGVLGPEWWPIVMANSRVYSGAPARMARQPSTVTEVVTSLKMSTTVDPRVKNHIDTIVDITEEGNEDLPEFEREYLSPDSDVVKGSWVDEDGVTTDLFSLIDDDTSVWPATGAALDERATTTANHDIYRCTLDASSFDVGGALENARIGFVNVQAIYSATEGFRKVRTFLRHTPSNTIYHPAGGSIRNAHYFGAIYLFWFGELNPQTMLPWTPADLASFGAGGDWELEVRSYSATATLRPRIHALQLEVYYSPVENREAVAVWRRPTNLGNRLHNAESDSLVSMPGGTAGWSKDTGKNYVYTWRQSVTPVLYGPTIAEDVKWNGAYQGLPSDAEPPGVVYPLTSNSSRTPGDDHMASDQRAYDTVGRLEGGFRGRLRTAPALVPMVSGVPSVDGQPYRMDLGDLIFFNVDDGYIAQRVTPDLSEDWLGFRFVIRPPFANVTITISVHDQATGTQVGGSASYTAGEVSSASKRTPELFHYVTGFLSAGASLTAATTYEIRLTPSGPGKEDWIIPCPNTSLAPEIAFGGGVDGLVTEGGASHDPNRNVPVALLKQPDPPTDFVAVITDVPVATQATGLTTVEHVALSWTAPAVSMGSDFRAYEIYRRLDGGTWHRIRTIEDEGTTAFVNHEAPRETLAEYRIRAVGADGRITQWVESNGVTPTAPGAYVILTSDHAPELECVYLYDRESSFPVLSTEEDEYVKLYGRDYQVAFMASEDRGIGWQSELVLNQITLEGKGGQHILRPLLDLVRSMDIPYVAVLDGRGTAVYGQVEVTSPQEQRTGHIFRAGMVATPTHGDPEPVAE